MKITIPISIGELLDKITILEIKSLFTSNEYVIKELEELNKIKDSIPTLLPEYINELRDVNQRLWEIEDNIREKEKLKEFDNEFIELARSVYINNDLRANIKKRINEQTNSYLKEVKLY